MEQVHVLMFALIMRGALADVSAELVDGRRQTKEVRGSKWNSGHDQVVPYFGFDHPLLTHWKPEISKPHITHIPHLPHIATVVKPHDSYVNKPDNFHHKPSTHFDDNKHEALYPMFYPVVYPSGLPQTWDHMLLNNNYYPYIHGEYHTTEKPNPCLTTESIKPSSTEQYTTETTKPCSADEPCATEQTSTEEPPLRSTQKPFLPYPVVGYPIEHLPVYHTTHKPQAGKPEQHSTTYSPEHHSTTHSKPNPPSKPDKPTFTSIFPNFWPFYTRQKDKDSQAAEASQPVSILYPFYKESKKIENTQNENLRSSEEKSNVKSTKS